LPRFFSSAEKGQDKVEEAVVSNGVRAGSEEQVQVQEEQEEKAETNEVDHVLEGAEDPMPESSLASSNKGLHFNLPGSVLLMPCSENEGILPARASDDEDEPAPGRHSAPFPSDHAKISIRRR
jgi:hypothetical protein